MRIIKIGDSFIFGVHHYDMNEVHEVLNYIKKNFKPNDKIVFMGEGGDDNNQYAEGSEQEAIKNGLEKYFTNFINDSWDGKDLNVLNPQSILFREMQTESGLPENKTMAAIYVIIVGQTGDSQEMSHLLNDEGIEWIKSFGVKNPKKPDEEDIELMYNLCFPQDTGKPETELSKLTDVFNFIRDKNLITKFKKYRKQGYKVIATAGEGHIDLIKNNFMDTTKNNMTESESLKGGLADGKTLKDVAKKHKIDVDLLKLQLQNGTKIEQGEHVKDGKTAKEIALDHLWEDPTYYIKLKKVEKKDVKETDASSAGGFDAPAFGVITKKKLQEEILSTGEFDVPAFGKTTKGGRKNPLKIGGVDTIYKNRAVKDKKWPRFGGPKAVYVKIKDKCKKFPYCNQGDQGNIEFIHEDQEIMNAIRETSEKYGIPYSEMEKIVLNEINKIFI